MRAILFFILFSGLFVTTTVAQGNGEVYPQQASIEHNQAVKDFSSEYFSTLPQGSQQLSKGISYGLVNLNGHENSILLSQTGYDLYGLVDITGSNNKGSMQQNGTNLESILELQGNSNQFEMLQTGNNLQNRFKIYSSGTNFEIQQNSSGMQFRQSGAGTIPLSIQQTGNSNPIIIRNN